MSVYCPTHNEVMDFLRDHRTYSGAIAIPGAPARPSRHRFPGLADLARWFMATGRVWNGLPGGRVVAHGAADPPPTAGGLTLYESYLSDVGLFTDTAGTTPVTSDGDLVACWTGQTAGNKIVQATSGSRPAYKVNYNGVATAVLFDGSADFLAIASPVSVGNNYAVFAGIRRNGAPGTYGYALWGSGSNNALLRAPNASTKLELVNSGVASVATGTNNVANTTWVQVGCIHTNTGTSRFRQAGSDDGTFSGGATPVLRIDAVGKDIDQADSFAGFFNGAMAFIVVYTGNGSASDAATVEAWAQTRYGFT